MLQVLLASNSVSSKCNINKINVIITTTKEKKYFYHLRVEERWQPVLNFYEINLKYSFHMLIKKHLIRKI